jgi:hypothetical protein
MSIDLEKVFSPDVLAALDERMRQIARDAQGASAAEEWLTVKQVATLTNLGEWHVRQFTARLREQRGPDLYQPNGRGTQPLRIRRACLRDLTGMGIKK